MALGPGRVAPELLSKVTKTLGITALDQWYYVSHHAATKAIGPVLRNFGSVASFLKSAYPDHHFDEQRLTPRRNQEREQKFIEVLIRKLFPNTEIHTKARKAVGIVNPETDAYLEIDFWIPSLKLGIEYQDRHHYEYTWYAHGALLDYQKRDRIKRERMAQLGYTLITIGFWWDKTLESIAATIRKFRPDLLQEYNTVSVEPIPDDPPSGYFSKPVVIPGVAGIMSPFIPRANFDPTNWYAGEKHDGIRGVYNAELNTMFSRSGNELSVHKTLLNDIPNMLVEGEITAGRGNYAKTAAVSYYMHHDKVQWPMFRYIVYDIPDSELGNYTQRYSDITSALTARPFIFAQSTFRVLLANKDHLKKLVDAIISDSGEGVIVQKDAQYEYGRAKSLAKIKVRRDSDAQVRKVNENSCTCTLLSFGTAEIMFSSDFDPSKVKERDVVSYYHNGYAQNGTPKQGEIYKVRHDVTWEGLILDNAENTAKRRSVKEAVGSGSLSPKIVARNKSGHWNKAKNVRAFFDQFASTVGFDPLVPDNWYPVKIQTLRNAGGTGIFYAHNFSLKRALSAAYPELKFEKEKFRTHEITRVRSKIGHWNKPANVRAFLEEFARTAGFDPLVPENWHSITTRSLENAGGGGLLKRSLTKALSFAYPEMRFEVEYFRTHDEDRNKIGHWRKSRNTRAFFDKFARDCGFDPLVTQNWYSVRSRPFKKAGGGGLLYAYNGSLRNALTDAYPELNFTAANFRLKTNG